VLGVADVPDGSFIGDLLRRHPLARSPWPSEDLLTEATGAVLRRSQALSRSLAGKLLGLSDDALPERVAVRTQMHIPHVGRLDLVLDGGPEHLVWMELKDRAPESGSQLTRYRERLQRGERAQYRRLVYLTRYGATGTSLPEVIHWSWWDVARFIGKWLDEHRERLEPLEHWIVNDYLKYLQQIGLVMLDPLSPDFPATLRSFGFVANQLLSLSDMLREQLAEMGWSSETSQCGFGGKRPQDWNDWWCAYEPRPPEAFSQGSAFDWGMLNLMQDGPAIFIAGLWLGESWDNERYRDWFEYMINVPTNDGFGPFEHPDGHSRERLCRSIEINQLGGRDLADQARSMAEFVARTFRLLEVNPPRA